MILLLSILPSFIKFLDKDLYKPKVGASRKLSKAYLVKLIPFIVLFIAELFISLELFILFSKFVKVCKEFAVKPSTICASFCLYTLTG